MERRHDGRNDLRRKCRRDRSRTHLLGTDHRLGRLLRRRGGRGLGRRRSSRYGLGHGHRFGLCYLGGRVDRLLRGRRSRRGSWRQEREWIDVALWITRRANAEVDERLGTVDITARADRSHDGSLANERAASHADRTEVDERRGVAEGRLDRDRLAAARDRAGERDDSLRRGQHHRARGRADVDAAVLPGGVWMSTVERERPQHRSVDRPGPGARNRHR